MEDNVRKYVSLRLGRTNGGRLDYVIEQRGSFTYIGQDLLVLKKGIKNGLRL